MDRLSKEQREKNMKAVKNKNSQIEIVLGRSLWNKGLRYRKNNKTVFGKPDFTFKKHKVAVFCDGEFWHGKDWEIRKHDHKSNQDFWLPKIEKNIERDKKVTAELEKQGWTVLRFWGKDILNNLENCVIEIENIIGEKNMKFKEKISIEEVGGKKIRLRRIEPESNKESVFTHYLHNSQNETSKFYKKDALEYAKEVLEYKYPEEEITLQTAEEALQYGIFNTFEVPFLPIEKPKFKFIDLFAGIGGFRLALQNLGGKCIYTSEWDSEAKRTYKANFGETPFGDITKEETKKYIPDNFDILCAGFPCQAFSIAGKRGGFEDTRGTLFFDVAEIIKIVA
jgi:DNA (cytosine-5)-methyltransferase 1